MNWLENLIIPTLSLNEKLVIILLLLVTLVVVYQATIRLFNQSFIRFILVLIANIVSLSAIIILIIPIQFNHKNFNTVALLTKGFSQSVISKEQICLKKPSIYYLNKSNVHGEITTLDIECDLNVLSINHISELPVFEPAINQLNVYGDGLSIEQWQQIQPLNSAFFPSKLKSGFINPQWEKEATLGETVTFKAKLQMASQSPRIDGIHSVQLIDVNGEVLKEVKVKNDEFFSFVFTPKTIGQHLYRVHLLDKSVSDKEAKTVLINEPFGVNIVASSIPRVLVVQSSPKYETKHFKHWLTENNGQLFTLTQISKNHVMTEEVNLMNDLSTFLAYSKQRKINTLNELLSTDLINYFDLVMIDSKALLSLNNDKLRLINNAIHNGLGLLIFTDESLVKVIKNNALPLLGGFQQQEINRSLNSREIDSSLNTNNDNQTKQVTLNWHNKITEHLIEANNIVLQTFSAFHLVYDQIKQPLVISNNRGKGKIALTTVNSSFQLKINDMYDDYSQYWQFITTSLASNKQRMFWLPQPKSALTFKGQMAKACFFSEEKLFNSANVSQINNPINRQKEQTTLYFDSHLKNKNRYCGLHFSGKGGWQQLLFMAKEDTQISLNNAHYIYHYEADDWLAWQQSLKHSYSEKMALKPAVANNHNTTNEYTKPVSKFLVLFILFICSSFLWIERKVF